MLSSELPRIGADGEVIEDGNLALQEAFFNPGELVEQGIDSILRGMATSLASEIDTQIVDDVRNFLFGPPGAGGFDLASLNIQRGRDHGLPDYNQARIDLGLDPVTSFADITSDPDIQAALEAAYGSVDDIDVWVGGLAEDHVHGSSVGELIQTMLVDQFERLRDGDRFWYQEIYRGELLHQIDHTTLADVIERNTEITGLARNVFADPSVIVLSVPEAKRTGKVSIKLRGDEIFVKAGKQKFRRPASEVSMIVIEGADGRRDKVKIDLRRGEMDLPGGIVFNGGEGPRDSLKIVTSRSAENITVEPDLVTIDGQTIACTDVEKVYVKVGRGDNVQMADNLPQGVRVRGRRANIQMIAAAALANARLTSVPEPPPPPVGEGEPPEMAPPPPRPR